MVKKILNLSGLIPDAYKWDGTNITKSSKVTATKGDQTKAVTWSKRSLKRKHHEVVSGNIEYRMSIDPYLCLVMTWDFLYGEGLKCSGSIANLIRSNENRLRDLQRQCEDENRIEDGVVVNSSLVKQIHRYLRVNTSRISVESVSVLIKTMIT